MKYDLAIIGGGPAGYNAAERAASNGLKTVLFEKNAIGGVCLNEGCIPTKTLLYSAKILDAAKTAAKYGILIGTEPSFDYSKIIGRKNKIVRKLTGAIKMKLVESGVSIVEGHASICNESDGSITISCNEELFSTKYLLLATGSETIIPPIKGLADINYWTSKDALECKDLPQSLTIVGGGVIGMEFASFFNSMGVKVTVIEMMSEILGVMDNECSAMLRADYIKKGITFFLETKLVEVRPTDVIVEKDGETIVIETEKILISVGRRPVTNNLGIEHLNLEFRGKGLCVNTFMQTSHPNVYACGDITGYSLLAHTAVREGEVAVNHILGIEDEICYKAIPAVVYTNPEMAGVGKTEDELTNNGIAFRTLKLPMTYSGRFVAENELGNGICKLIIDENERIIGCHMLGNPASELIVIAGIAIDRELTISEFKKIVFPHPTVGEIFHESLF